MKTQQRLTRVATLVLLYGLTGCFDTRISPAELIELHSHIDKGFSQALAGTWTSDKAEISITPANDGLFTFRIVDLKGEALPLCPKNGAGFVATIEGVAIAFLNDPMSEEGDDIIHRKPATGGKWGAYAIKLDESKHSVSAAELKELGNETTYRAVVDYIKNTTIRRDFTFTRGH